MKKALMPKPRKRNWKFLLFCLFLLAAEFLLVWEAKLILFWKNGSLPLLKKTEEIQEKLARSEAELKEINRQRLTNLMLRPDPVFSEMTACSCTWHDYEFEGIRFRYPEGMKVKNILVTEGESCGSGFELASPEDEDYLLEIGFGTKPLPSTCQKGCLLTRDYLPTLTGARVGYLPPEYSQETFDYLENLWDEEFTLMIRFGDGVEGHCGGWLKTRYRNWYQRTVALGVAGSIRLEKKVAGE